MLKRLTDLGHRVVTADAAPAPFAGVVEASLPVGDHRTETVLPVVAEYHRSRPFTGVALFHELTVVPSSRVAAALGLPHFPLDQVTACVDKLEMRRWMHACGVPCPPFAGARTLADARRAAAEIGYPLVVKPTVGGASYGVTRVDDDAALARFFAGIDIFWEPREFVVERYLPGHEVSVETVSMDGGRHTHLAVFDKPQALHGPYFLEEVYVTPGWRGPAEEASVRAAVSDLVRRLGLARCITHTEVRLTPAGPMIVEFGLRPIGWPGPLCVAAATGVDQIALMAAIAEGEPLAADPRPHGAAGWRYLVIREPGTVLGTPSAAALDGVLDASVWVARGEVVDVPPRQFSYIKGHLALVRATSDEVGAALTGADWELTVSPVDAARRG